MAKCGYNIVTGGAIALTAATAKTVLSVSGASTHGVDLKKVTIGFDGVTAGAVPVLIEVCYWSGTAGTATSVTPTQTYGRVITWGGTASKTYTAEPTTLTTIKELLITPYGGAMLYDVPLGDTPDSAVSAGFALRFTAPAAVNVRASMDFERC